MWGWLLFLNSFEKKLVCLLSLEFIMILFVFYCFNFSMEPFSTFILFLFLCFMVLDSVLGITLLIGSSRHPKILVDKSSFF